MVRGHARLSVAEKRSSSVAFIPSADDTRFVEQLRGGDAIAIGALFDRHAAAVERVLHRVLGVDPEVQDLLQEVFVHAMTGIRSYRGDASSLRPWLTQIAIRNARKCIRRRRTRRWLGLRTPGDLPEAPAPEDTEMQATLRRAYAVLETMPARERIPFALRFIEGMALQEVADACETSLATIKRRLSQARRRFERLAARDPVLSAWVEGDA